jgi:hypothetical protein
MNTWADVQCFINKHKLPLSLFRFNMARDGRLIDLATGDVVASTVKEARAYLQPSA